MNRLLILFGLLWLACSPTVEMLSDPDPGLADLAITDVFPPTILPASLLVIRGRSLPGPGDGSIHLWLSGTSKLPGTVPRSLDVRLRAEYVSAQEAQLRIDTEVLQALGGNTVEFSGHAKIVVESVIDRREHVTEPIQLSLKLVPSLSPRLDLVELAGPQRTTGKIHPNDWLIVRGDGLLLGGGEGVTVALLSGCFLPEGASEPCSANGKTVREVEIPVQPQSRFDRTNGVLPYSPTIHGVMPGKFVGTILLRNQPPGTTMKPVSASRTLAVTQVRPELTGVAPSAASLGQYVEMQGAGFIGGQPGQATLVRLQGQFSLENSPVMIPVDTEIVLKWLARFPSPVGRYVLDETDALGQALESRGGLREAAGVFVGTGTMTLRNGKETVASKPTPLRIALLRPKQVVVVRFLSSYQDSLRLFGLRAVDNAVRARVLEVARRDYAGINIEFREGGEDMPLPEDFAYYAQVDIGGPDPNGLGYLGYDNTPGRDMQNRRLYDRIGGVNAVTQNDGAPGYGGVFAEQLLGFSNHPGSVAAIKSGPQEADLFDQVFDPLRPDTGGNPATLREATLLPALSSGSLCPASKDDRPHQVACGIFVLGSLIGTTMTHELGHSLGLANPDNRNGSYHNNGSLRGRIMNPGSLRSFRERAELSPSGPAVFCDTDYAYLRKILPGSALPPSIERPACLDTPAL
ncbi:MAG: hypothetical protein U0787_03080 [Polyangia bacterium]